MGASRTVPDLTEVCREADCLPGSGQENLRERKYSHLKMERYSRDFLKITIKDEINSFIEKEIIDKENFNRAAICAEYDYRLLRSAVFGSMGGKLYDNYLGSSSLIFPEISSHLADSAWRRINAGWGAEVAGDEMCRRLMGGALGLVDGLPEATALARADLLARPYLPVETTLSPLFEYMASDIEAASAYAESALLDLEADYERGKNPVHAWEAVALADSCGLPVPAWALDYLAQAACQIISLREDVIEAKSRGRNRPLGRETEQVAKALGFGVGRGRGGWIETAAVLEVDRDIYQRVLEATGRGTPLTLAYEDVAAVMGVSRSKVQSAWTRVRKLRGDSGEE